MPTSIRHGVNGLRSPHIFASTFCRLPSCQGCAYAYRLEQLCSPDLAVATVVGIVADEVAEFVAIGLGSVVAFAAIVVEAEIHIRILGRSAHLC